MIELVLKKQWEKKNLCIKPKDLDKGKRLVVQAVRALNSLNDIVHLFMTPTLKEDLGLDEVSRLYEHLSGRIAKQDNQKRVKKTGPVTHLPQYTIVFIEDTDSMQDLINTISKLAQPKDQALVLFMDTEGYSLGRNGTLSIVQIYIRELSTVYIVDVHTLGGLAFTTSTPESGSFKDILESTNISKAFWDCRAGSDALYAHFDVRFDSAAVIDLQLLDLATIEDKRSRRRLKSLSTGVQSRIHLSAAEEEMWANAKEEGCHIMLEGPDWQAKLARDVAKANECYDSIYPKEDDAIKEMTHDMSAVKLVNDAWDQRQTWDQRPLPQALLLYACGDVVLLPALYEHYLGHSTLTPERKKAVEREIEKRIAGSQAEHCPQCGNEAPDGWDDKEW